jgi:hypothetical protein
MFYRNLFFTDNLIKCLIGYWFAIIAINNNENSDQTNQSKTIIKGRFSIEEITLHY